MLKLEAITVSINYSEFLAEVAPLNAPIFDRWIVVTSPEDTATRLICRKYGMQCVLSEDHKRNGDVFNKGRLIDKGLSLTSANCWRVCCDSDIAFPSMTRSILESANLDDTKLYGCDRIMVRSAKAWDQLLQSGWLRGETRHYPNSIVFPSGYDVGARWVSDTQGFVPIGFTQIWHAKSDEWLGTRIRQYPMSHGDCCRTDVQHGISFDRRKRELLGELVVAHLESEGSTHAMNWSGRKSAPFRSTSLTSPRTATLTTSVPTQSIS